MNANTHMHGTYAMPYASPYVPAPTVQPAYAGHYEGGIPWPYVPAYQSPAPYPTPHPYGANMAASGAYHGYPYDHALAMAYNEGLEGRSHRRHHSSHGE